MYGILLEHRFKIVLRSICKIIIAYYDHWPVFRTANICSVSIGTAFTEHMIESENQTVGVERLRTLIGVID